MMSMIPIDSIYSGWAPELSSISIYWPCLWHHTVVVVWSNWNPNGCLHLQRAPPESRLLSPFLENPPLPATTAVPWSRLHHCPHCAIWAALDVPCPLSVCCFLFSAFFPSLLPTHPHSSLGFLKSRWTKSHGRRWVSSDSLKTTALHSGAMLHLEGLSPPLSPSGFALGLFMLTEYWSLAQE